VCKFGRRADRECLYVTEVAPVLFGATLVSRMNSLEVAGTPMDFKKLTMRTIVRYMKSHEGIERVSKGLMAAGKPTP
jgi:hypothetical protein